MFIRNRNSSTIRFQLTDLVVACVLPVWLIAGFLVLHTYSSKLHELDKDMLENARAMTMVVDQELTNVQAALLALATSPSFNKGDFRDVHRQTLELLRSYPGADIIVADSTGQQLVNSYRPYGSPLPKRNNLDLVRTIFETGKPITSNLFFGALTKRPLIAIDVPVFLNGKVAYDLSMTFSSKRLASIFPSRHFPDGWYCTILDRNGVIVARTRDSERFVGKLAGPGIRQAMAAAKEGTADLKNIAGITVLAGFAKSPSSGWAVTFGVPKATIMAEIYQWMAWAIGGATTISLIGIFLAMRIARRIAENIQSLVEPALAIGRGEFVSSIGSKTIKETAEVADALVQASDLLQQRAKERDKAEEQLSLTFEELRKETTERLRAMEELRKKEQLLIQQSRQAALGEMIGNIAHQWRQPLNALGLLVQQPSLFYEFGDVNKDYLDEHAKKSMEIVQHMSRTIDDFRNFFQPDKEKHPFKVREVVDKTLSLMEGSFQGQQTVIEVEAKGDPTSHGYPNEFSQVLLNILINARDAMAERDTARPKVVITISTEENRSVVTIADNGGGIPEEIIGKIFDPYFTTKGPQAGTGIGLFMSKTIIDKNMGGLLTVRNIEGGAEFRIEF